jgi:hypothetical protein
MLAFLFVIFAVAFRFLPHPYTFTPVAAALLFFGARGPRRLFWVPVALLIASDLILTPFVYSYPLSPDHFVTWAWYGAIVLLGSALRNNAKPLRLLGASLTASVSFFLLSNFAVWAVWKMYPKTLSGLAAAYDAGIPFFRHEVAGDLLFTAAMFGTPVLIQAIHKARGEVQADRIASA